MKAYLYSLKQVFKASPLLVIAHLLCTVLPSAVLSGLLVSANRDMLNGVQNYIVGSLALDALITLVVIYCLYRLLNMSVNIIKPYIKELLSNKIRLRIKEETNKKYAKLKYEYFEQDQFLDLINKSEGAAYRIEDTYSSMVNCASQISSCVSIAIALLAVSLEFTLIALGVGIVASVLQFIHARIELKLYSWQSVDRRKLSAYEQVAISDLYRRMSENRVFNTADKVVEYSYQNTKRIKEKLVLQNKKMYILNVVAVCLPTMVAIGYVVYVVVSIVVKNNSFALGDLTIGITKFSSLVSSVSMVLMQFTRIRTNSKYLNYYFEFQNLEEEPIGTVETLPNNPVVQIKNLCFTYPGTEKQVLNNVSFNITLGEHIAFVGKNGSGKSTIIKLILGLYEPTSGEITVNGVPIRDYTLEARQELFGVQYQDFYSFDLKIRDVVAVGNINIREKDNTIYSVLRQANILDTLKEKDATLDTQVGSRWSDDAIEFSGGEKQRMSLATTLAYNHKHLILDEPTAALDAVAENKMYEVFMSGIKNKGSLIVSHRLASSRIADRIIVFDNGSVVQDGNYNELIKDKNGLYYQMFTAQAKLYKGNTNEED